MIIKCTMREGITEADIEGYRYTFRPDGAGNPLCSVTKESHIKQILDMGPHCYIEFHPPIPYSQMSAAEIMALPDGEAEDHKERIRLERERAAAIEDEKKKQAETTVDARLKKLEDNADNGEDPDKEKNEAPAVSSSAAAGLAEARITEIINSFRTLSKKRFETWIENNRDQVTLMPEDVKIALAKKVVKTWPKKDPGIEGLDLEKYAPSTDATD